MSKLITNQITKKLPADFSKHAVRDISLLTCSVLGETHAITTKKLFGVDFSATLWLVKNSLIVFYRSLKEYQNFSKRLGERFRKNANYTKKITDTLIKITDWFNDFFKNQKKLVSFTPLSEVFFNTYREFFAYHQAVYWGGDYLTKLDLSEKESKKIKPLIKILNSAYKYNELVIPNIEKYFKKLKIQNLLYDEINKNLPAAVKLKPQERSLLFVNNKRYVLSNTQASKLEKFIEKKQKKPGLKLKKISGLSANKGLVRGRVKLICDLNKLKETRKGDVLVTPMTRPQFNKSIKQASAIITNEGGLLSHAAILSREFNIPCIVGTHNATQVLKTGDFVEVNANKGIVKK